MTAAAAEPDPAEPLDLITAGEHYLRLPCPSCQAILTFRITLMGRLTLDVETSRVQPRMISKSADHVCRDDDGTPPLFSLAGDLADDDG